MVEVFKTNIKDKRSAKKVLDSLSNLLPDCEINFDLTDCDNVLRIKGIMIIPTKIAAQLREMGYECELLE